MSSCFFTPYLATEIAVMLSLQIGIDPEVNAQFASNEVKQFAITKAAKLSERLDTHRPSDDGKIYGEVRLAFDSLRQVCKRATEGVPITFSLI